MTPEELNDQLNYHQDQLKYSGFGEVPEKELTRILTSQNKEEVLKIEKNYNGSKVEFELNYDKSDQGKSFMNNYRATLKKTGADPVSQLFYANNKITAKEAFNMLEGRAVQKTYNHHEKVNENGKDKFVPIKDSLYNQWVKIDFTDTDKNGNYKLKTFGEKWGFNLEQEVNKLNLIEIKDKDGKEVFMDSLRRGNLQSGTLEVNADKVTRYVEANPHRRQLNVYDHNMEPVLDSKQAKALEISKAKGQNTKQSESQGEKSSQSSRQSSQKAGKPMQEDEAPDIPQQQKKTRRKQSM